MISAHHTHRDGYDENLNSDLELPQFKKLIFTFGGELVMKIRTQITLLCVTVAMLASADAASAGITDMKDSADFMYQYNGDTTPADPTVAGEFGNTGYVASTNNNLTMTSDGDVLTLSPTVAGTDTSLNMGSAVWDSEISDATGFTWEISIKLNPIDGPDFPPFGRNRHLFRVGDGSDTSSAQLQIDWDADLNNGGIPGGPNLPSVSDAQHVYRMAQASNSNETHLWVDGQLLSSNLKLGPGNASNHWWGDFFGRPISSEIDYVRWEVGGFAPIPEPASASLLVIGALALWSRRRR